MRPGPAATGRAGPETRLGQPSLILFIYYLAATPVVNLEYIYINLTTETGEFLNRWFCPDCIKLEA